MFGETVPSIVRDIIMRVARHAVEKYQNADPNLITEFPPYYFPIPYDEKDRILVELLALEDLEEDDFDNSLGHYMRALTEVENEYTILQLTDSMENLSLDQVEDGQVDGYSGDEFYIQDNHSLLQKHKEDLKKSLADLEYEKLVKEEQAERRRKVAQNINLNPKKKRRRRGRGANRKVLNTTSSQPKPLSEIEKEQLYEEALRQAEGYITSNRMKWRDAIKVIRSVIKENPHVIQAGSVTVRGSHVTLHRPGLKSATISPKHGSGKTGRTDLSFNSSRVKTFLADLLCMNFERNGI